MNTYLLTWNPKGWLWPSLVDEARETRFGKKTAGKWSTGNTTRIVKGDRLFLLRQGKDKPGIMARATATGPVYKDRHFTDQDKEALFVPLIFDELIDPEAEPPLASADLNGVLGDKHLHSQSSGIRIPEEAAGKLEELWRSHLTRIGHDVFEIGSLYTRDDIYRILAVPKQQQGGDWDTGSHRHGDEYFIFANVESAGRTGHNYGNHWIGNHLYWRGRTGSKLQNLSVQQMLRSAVHIFTRTHDRDPFRYEGLGKPLRKEDTVPVTIVWRFSTPRAEDLPEEAGSQQEYREGGMVTIIVNAYERNPDARRACIAHWGTACVVCDFRFDARYGAIGTDFIHVHHLRALRDIGEEYVVNPIEDLRPVCPNCHAMIHKRTPHFSIEEMKSRLK